MAKYLQKRGSVYYFVRRIPEELRDRYPGATIRDSLHTEDERVALRAVERLTASYDATWASMRGNAELTPAQTHTAAQALADELGPWDIASDYFSDKWNKHADKSGLFGHPMASEMIKEKDYLSPVELKALELLRDGKSQSPKLSAALTAYISNHKNAGKKRFVAQAERDWGRLLTVAGDIPIVDLGREHARLYLKHCAANDLATTSARRCVNNVCAILNFGVKELDIRGALNPFSDLSIPNEGADAKPVKTPSPSELHEILLRFGDDTRDTGLIILLQMGLGTRVGEVSGLAVADVHLDAETPHVFLRVNATRGLKNKNSRRKTPLVGFALEAAKVAVKKAGDGPALFARYAKENGNTNASSAVNARLEKWEIGSHGFRHAMTDLLRAAGCPADIRKTITGHTADGVSESYGDGFGLQQRAEWITKALALIQPATASQAAADTVAS